MKCFVHLGVEAISVCRNCGKGMCAECSAYSGHSGICPECRKKEFIQERNNLINENKRLVWEIVKQAFWSILIITIPVTAFKIVRRVLRRKANTERIGKLTAEIDKLEKVLSSRGGSAFI